MGNIIMAGRQKTSKKTFEFVSYRLSPGALKSKVGTKNGHYHLKGVSLSRPGIRTIRFQLWEEKMRIQVRPIGTMPSAVTTAARSNPCPVCRGVLTFAPPTVATTVVVTAKLTRWALLAVPTAARAIGAIISKLRRTC